jgi:hypothetical protein
VDLAALQQPWPKQRVRELEVGRHPVRWRHRLSKAEGIRAGVRFVAPHARQAVWDLATDYRGVGGHTPGVAGVRVVEESETRQVIEVEARVLWRQVTIAFEVERHAPESLQFRLIRPAIGQFAGVCTFSEQAGKAGGQETVVELSTWLTPPAHVPLGLLLVFERVALLQGTRGFLESCDRLVRQR